MVLGEDGLDLVEFMILFNEGEFFKVFVKVVSGGEKVRFMFVLKFFYVINSDLSFLVFDEIDIGIFGKIVIKMVNVMKCYVKMM